MMTSVFNDHENELDEDVYLKLKTIANKLMSQERQGHTLSPTDLVHEAYVQLSHSKLDDSKNNAYLFILARQMRRLLIDYGRQKATMKHGAYLNRVNFTEGLQIAGFKVMDFAAINQAIDELELVSERCAKIIELLYFTGISREKTAEISEVSMATLAREVRFAKAFIADFLNETSLN
ncbi:ECF-type sigma factor [Marinicella rhabdoformis]|uniref:ECF-type sigma factor n=1 Tax=Marinicella rhabdoformis TaxID=2580566 RepID=UPI0015D0CCC6|nr:ECF-type sigma factor [Marinicella rhabdoformis]